MGEPSRNQEEPKLAEAGKTAFAAALRECIRIGCGREVDLHGKPAHWKQKELAEEVGVTERTIGHWRAGTRPISAENASELLRAMHPKAPLHEVAFARLRAACYSEAAYSDATTSALPPKPERFGRGAELGALMEALEAPRPTVLVTGPPGIGKSHLSLQALHDPASVARYGDRRWFVRLDGATTADAIYPEIARTLGIESGSGLDAAVDGRLGGAPGLLVLDNAETPWWAEARGSEAVFGRLAAIEPLALVVSIRGDRAPPAPRWTGAIAVNTLDDEDASDLFNALTGQRFAADPDLAGLLADMDGVPLAIELLAKAIGTGESDLARIRRRWEDRRTSLLAVRRGAEGRLESWEISLRLSLDQLDADGPELRLFALMGHLPDGVAEDHLDALLGEPGIDAADRLAELALVREQAARYRMLAPIRAFAADHCPADPADDDRRQAHYRGLAALGEQVGAEGGAEAGRRLEADLRNIETTIADGLDAADPAPAIEAAFQLHDFIRFSGLATDRVLRLADASAAAIDVLRLQAQCAFALGLIALDRSDHDAARDLFQRALPLYQKVGHVRGEADCIESLGNIALRRSEHDAARDLFQRALPFHQKVGYVRGEANCIQSLGLIALERSEHDAARDLFQRAMPLYQKVGHVLGEANCIKYLGHIALARSDHDAARDLFNRALPLYQKIGSVLGEANCISRLGEVAAAEGETAAAVRLIGEALDLYARIPSPYSMGLARAHLAMLTGGAERAAHLAEARRLWEPLRLPHLLAELDTIADES